MTVNAHASTLRVEKRRADAQVRLSNGEVKLGCFFVAGASSRHVGPERIGDLLNSEGGFVPFEMQDGVNRRTALLNPAHIVSVVLSDDEASRDPGYVVAPRHDVTIVLSTGQRLTGTVRVYRPDGHDRLSDWSRQPETFRYLESGTLTLLVNTTHIVEIAEASES